MWSRSYLITSFWLWWNRLRQKPRPPVIYRQDVGPIPALDYDLPCPHCGGPTILEYGVAGGGGKGTYSYCLTCNVIVTKSPAA